MFFELLGIQKKRGVEVGIRRAKSDRTVIISGPLQDNRCLDVNLGTGKKLHTLRLRLSHESSDIDS
jgi:hypothetical protein